MKSALLFITLLFLSYFPLYAQRSITVAGYVRDSENGEALVGAAVQTADALKGTSTNQYGYFSLTLPPEVTSLRVSYVGFTATTVQVRVRRDTMLTVQLRADTLATLVVRQPVLLRTEAGFLTMPVSLLKRVPMLLGEADLLKALATTPGIAVGQEGSSGLYVRGSSPEQNLVLLDEVPVYNTAHAFGFFSAFNPDAIRHIDVYKGSFPARYGGRLASVLDISMKEGNNQKTSQEVGVGVVSSRFLAEGPLRKGTSSYMVAGRIMNTGLLFLPQNIRLWTGGNVDNLINLWFYDLNAKINHRFNDKNQLFFSVYNNNDFFRNAEQRGDNRTIFDLTWGNLTSTLRYNRVITPKLFGKVTLLYSRFKYGFGGSSRTTVSDEVLENSVGIQNTVRDWGVKAGLEYTPSSAYTLRVGFDQFWHRFHPGRVNIVDDNQPVMNQPGVNLPIYAQEQAVYLENDWQPRSWLRLNVGARLPRFAVEGTTYLAWEPRMSLGIKLLPGLTVNAGASSMSQFIHQLSSNGVGLPNDIWVPVTARIRPAMARQLEVGLHWTDQKAWRVSVETYRKTMNSLIDYPQGVDIVSDFRRNWQELIIQPVKGRAVGYEVMVQRTAGRLTGWISYTNARSERQARTINEGRWYPARYDRRHNLALVGAYQLSPSWLLSANWTYQTGFPVTLPTGAQIGFDGQPRPIYEDRNNYRMPDYHRLDLGATYSLTTRRGRRASWNVGAYNAYNRSNPYYLEPQTSSQRVQTGGQSQVVFERMQITKQAILPILPYVSYQLKIN